MEKKIETKEIYEAPVIEAIDVRVEHGFQVSPPSPGGGSGNPNDDDPDGSF